MPTLLTIRCSPFDAQSDDKIEKHVAKQMSEAYGSWRIRKRSIDSRKNPVVIQLQVEVFAKGEEIPSLFIPKLELDVRKAPEAIVVGAGPAGLFAAYELIIQGVKPIVLERGKKVKQRRRDLVKIIREHKVDEDSNYCFGEGGAGTYSDGKLYTRSKKRGDVKRIYETFVAHGADETILVEAHPHIGTNKLPSIITSMRENIEACGGEVLFEKRVSDFLLDKDSLVGVTTEDGSTFHGPVILATGHSARDIFQLLKEHKIAIEAKPFALGVRVEHPQSIIDNIQYHGFDRGDVLPPASYSLVQQVDGRGVYSFCMCPGGIIAPCATSNGEVVTNGWSPSKRNNPYANSGMVVTVDEADWKAHKKEGALAALALQSAVEKACWEAAGKSQKVPAQRLVDFVNGGNSKTLPDCSYGPGLVPARIDQLLPKAVSKRLQEAFKAFDRKMRGYLHRDAIVVAPESRTSSPVRIPRNAETLEHPEIAGLYPCGEGAGYAGGIVSAALDGIKTARALASKLLAGSN